LGGGSVILCSVMVESNTAMGPSVPPGDQYFGGGIFIAPGATVYIDVSSVDSVDPTVVTNNTDSSGLNGSTANIDGSYIVQSC
jgi:hypothetical protein